MHELGLLSSMVKTIEKIAEEQHIEKIQKVVIEVGELSGALPHYIEECYPAAVYKTFMEDTELEMIVVPGIARCKDCGEEFNAMEADLKCPKCQGENLEALSGRDLIIKEIVCT